MEELVIKKSCIEGNGLFSTKEYKKGDKIVRLRCSISLQPPKGGEFFVHAQCDGKPVFVNLKCDKEEKNLPFNDVSRLNISDAGHRTFVKGLESVKLYRLSAKKTNVCIEVEGNVANLASPSITDVWLTASCDIAQDDELLVSYGVHYWLNQIRRAEGQRNLNVLLICHVLSSSLLQHKPDKDKKDESDYIADIASWRSWSENACQKFIEEWLNITQKDTRLEDLKCIGYSYQVVLYRLLQSVGYVMPRPESLYTKFPSHLKKMVHESRDLCFWPVQVDSEEIEKLRQKTCDGIEYGPNATWWLFSKTKQLFKAAKTNDLSQAEKIIKESNVNAYGTCQLWTPLHVAARCGSASVAKLLLNNGAALNTTDRQGRTPLRLAQDNNHKKVEKLLKEAYAASNIAVDETKHVRPTYEPKEGDGKLVNEAVQLKVKGIEAYSKGNFKSAFKLLTDAIEICPPNHSEAVILYSNRAQVFIKAGAYNLALRDCWKAMRLDPLHTETMIRIAHVYQNTDISLSLQMLDLMMFTSVPTNFIQDQRSALFLKSIMDKSISQQKESEEKVSTSVNISGEEFKSDNIAVERLLDLSLIDLRNVDQAVGQWDREINHSLCQY